MNRTKILVGVLLPLTPLTADAVVILHTTYTANGGQINPPDHANVDQGYSAHKTLSDQDQFKAVGDRGGCTSTLIGMDTSGNSYFLTAAHCYDHVSGSTATINNFSFTDWNGSVHTTATAEVFKHPTYTSANGLRDIAIVKVPDIINITGWTKPMIYSGGAEVGKTLTWIGYGTRGIGGLPGGVTGTTGQDSGLYGSGRAAGRNIIDSIVDGYLEFDFDAPDTAVDQYEGHLSSGDSGGSGWIQVNGKWMIAGIVSTSGAPEVYGEGNSMTRVSEVQSWISSVYSGAQFAVPEPSSIGMLGGAGIILIFRRRKGMQKK